MKKRSYGPLFHHGLPDYSGKWIQSLIKRISRMSCMFGDTTKNLPNGINVQNCKDIYSVDKAMGDEVAKFMVGTYITKNSCRRVVNIVLFNVDRDYISIVNKNVVESIITILNHPHFHGCHSIDDIKKKILSVENLNDRFVEEISEEEAPVQEEKYVKRDLLFD